MSRRQKPTPSRVHKPKPADSCRRPPRSSDTLTALVHEYQREYIPAHQDLLDCYRQAKSLAEAIEYATGSVGKVPDHQRRVGRRILNKATQKLLTHQRQIKNCDSFDSLIRLVERTTADFHRFGELAVYDTSLRLGAWLKKMPKKVYLHAGTRKGARALGLDISRGYIEMDELPKPIHRLEPWQAEDFLCIYEDRFSGLKRKVKGR